MARFPSIDLKTMGFLTNSITTKLRKLAHNGGHPEATTFSTVTVVQTPDVPFAETPARDNLTSRAEPAVTIKIKKSLIQMSFTVSKILMIEL